MSGPFAPPRPRDVDLADTAHAVLVEPALDGVSGLAPARHARQDVEEGLVVDGLQERHDRRVWADHVRDVQQRQPHLRRHVVGHRLGQRVGRIPVLKPRLQVVPEPPARLHSRHDHLTARRIEQDPPELLDVLEDELDQRRPGRRQDVAPHGGEGGLGAADQLGDDAGIGLDRDGRSGSRRHRGGGLVRERPDEVTAVDDGLQRIPDQRIGSPQDVEEAGADLRRGEALRDVDEQTAARLRHRPGRRQLPEGEPQGLHGVGHHLLVADGDVDAVRLVDGSGDREQRGNGPALDDPEAVVDQAPFDVLGMAEVRFDPPAELHELRDLCVRERRLLHGRDRLGEDLAASHRVDVRVHPARDESLADAESCLHRGHGPVARDGIGSEENSGRSREGHALHHHGHVGAAVVQAVAHAVDDGPLGEQ